MKLLLHSSGKMEGGDMGLLCVSEYLCVYPSRVEDFRLLRGGKGGHSLALAYIGGHKYL